MLEVDELIALYIEAQARVALLWEVWKETPQLRGALSNFDICVDNLQEHLALTAAETGIDRELCYSPNRHMEDTIENYLKTSRLLATTRA